MISEDKLKGLFFGGALGDALGAPHEFSYHDQNYSGKLEHKMKVLRRYKGASFCQIGQITDDTEMSIMILNSLVTNKCKYVKDDLIIRYLEWANDPGSWAMGRNTRALSTSMEI